MERNYRNHSIIFGLDEYPQENKYSTTYRVLDLFANEMQLTTYGDAIDNCYWIGNRRGRRPLLVRFTRTITKDEVLENARMLKGKRIRVDKDYGFQTRRIRREL